MANYIELIGSPGVGKTTTYNALAGNYAADVDWVLYEELCGIQPKKTVKEQIKQHLKKITKPQSTPSLPYVERDRHVLDRFIKNHPDLIELFWQTLPKSSNVYGKDLRGVVVGYVMEVLEKIQRVKESHSTKYCLIDEGIIHNTNYFVPSHLTDPVYESQVR